MPIAHVPGTAQPKYLVQKCCRAIQTALRIPYVLTFEHHVAPKHQEVYSLIDVSTAETERSYQVIPFPELDNVWLAASWTFEFRTGTPYLINASLAIFRGIATDRKKSALLRAEWDPPAQTEEWSHAQPHWHIYQAEIDSEQQSIRQGFQTGLDMELSAVEELRSATLRQRSEASHFHFAMASQWHINGTHQFELQSDTMLSWLSGCLKYIRSELYFLKSNSGS